MVVNYAPYIHQPPITTLEPLQVDDLPRKSLPNPTPPIVKQEKTHLSSPEKILVGLAALNSIINVGIGNADVMSNTPDTYWLNYSTAAIYGAISILFSRSAWLRIKNN